MELIKPASLPWPDPGRDAIDLAHIDAAIELVRRGTASRVRLAGVSSAEQLAPVALSLAQAAGVPFHVDRGDSALTLTFGPLA